MMKTANMERKNNMTELKSKCPDCGNDNMKEVGERFDALSEKRKQAKQCSQCRRWVFNA
jgi:predicted  nucleic acid-binding Zn-ribbon protein